MVIKEIIPDFIRSTDVHTIAGMKFYRLVEGLDPVYRDLGNIPEIKPLLPTKNGNPYEVKHIFSLKEKKQN